MPDRRRVDENGAAEQPSNVTAEQIIREIQTLSVEEQAKVIRFAYHLDSERKLTGPELSALAERMAKTTDAAEAMMLREEIARGFYGKSDA